LGRKKQTKYKEENSKLILMKRRKSKEPKEVAVHVNIRSNLEVKKLKYLRIIFDYKLNFRVNINYVTDKSKKLIFQLAKSAKLNWGLSHKALQTINLGVYTGTQCGSKP